MASAQAAEVQVKVTVENVAPQNSISFAPLRLGFNNGTFDAFNIGQAATAPIISVAEGGSGANWFPAFAAADPTAVLGTVLASSPPIQLLPGEMGSSTFTVDTAVNPYFTFAAMVVPSNDFFIGNDSPAQFRLFDNAGGLLINSISQHASNIWDAGSEVFDPAAAAFVGDNDLRTPQNSVVSFNFAELSGFNGLTTSAGYDFNSQLAGNTEVYRISFEVSPVPEPETYALMLTGLVMVGWMARRRRAMI
ncbi:MAG: spondin domain-containing protein [Pseudomonadota bacterium]|nr:spondin domain-containing protein [Pseudomonadota bacterium]